jgi:tetratricopeptide (TPR) repeat protein
MTELVAWLRARPHAVLVALALVFATAIYAPTLDRGLTNYDDPWLVHDNWIVQRTSLASVEAIVLDTSVDTRAVLGAEYLPVRDLSVMADFAIYGDAYAGFHVTNLLLYLGAILLWYLALAAFGIDRDVAALATLIWAVHPAHAETVAWLAERKGVLAIMFAGACALGYARWRAGGRARWLVLAIGAAVCAVWSKAPAAFAVAALAGLELALPAARVAWRRSLAGLGAIAVATGAAFVPVLIVATKLSVVASGDAPAGYAAMALGLHGFYLRLAAMTVPNAASYPIATDGPTAFDIALGAIGLVAILALALVPARGRFRPPPALRAAAVLWLFGWFPVSRLALPLRSVLVADRYLVIGSVGVALALAVAITAIPRPRARRALAAVLVTAAAILALDAQSHWRDATALWATATASNPNDGDAWSMYAEALADAGQRDAAAAAVETGLSHVHAPRLVHRAAMLAMARGDRPNAIALLSEAANAGEPHAMANLALMLAEGGDTANALGWAIRATETAPLYANGWRIAGKLALATDPAQALRSFTRAYQLEPLALANRFNLALALLALHRPADARPHLEACLVDPQLADRARALLSSTP